MNHHRQALTPILALALISALAAGCSPAPEPTPTPTPAFASEEEAFAAAEETYRAYMEAFNAVDLSSPDTFEPLFALTSGDFEASDRKTLSELHAEKYTFVGQMVLVKFSPLRGDSLLHQVVAEVCVDVSASDVIDQSGRSVVNVDRPDMNPLLVTFALAEGALLIDRADRDEEIPCESP